MRGLLFLFGFLSLWWIQISPAGAGNPLHMGSDGRPIIWDTSKPIPYVVDIGGYGRLDYDQSLALVQLALQTYEDVPLINLSFEYRGSTHFNVNSENFDDVLQAYYEQGVLVIVFDDDGALTSSQGHVLGRAFSIKDGLNRFRSASLAMNSLILDGDDGVQDLTLIDTLGVLIHEMGHVLGLDHSTLNYDASYIDPRYLPTMYPYSYVGQGQHQVSLHPDDIATLQWMYLRKEVDFQVSGTVYDANQNPVYSLAVTARKADSPLCQAYQQVTGISCLESQENELDCAIFEEEGLFEIPVLEAGAYSVEVASLPNFGPSNPKYKYQSKPPLEIPGEVEFFNFDDTGVEDPYFYDFVFVEGRHYEIDFQLSSVISDLFFDLSFFDSDRAFINDQDDDLCPAHLSLDVAFLIGAEEIVKSESGSDLTEIALDDHLTPDQNNQIDLEEEGVSLSESPVSAPTAGCSLHLGKKNTDEMGLGWVLLFVGLFLIRSHMVLDKTLSKKI